MAIKPMPTPTADSYYTINTNNTNKTKKKKQSAANMVTNTAGPPPQPAAEVPSTPSVTSNYTQPAPKPNTSSQTSSNLSNASSYNPLSLKQNSQSNQKSAMDTIYNKTVTYDAVPTPQKQHGSYKAQTQKSYSYTETKPKANQYAGNGVNTDKTANNYSYNQPKTYTYNQPKIYASTPPKTDIGEYKTLGGYTNTNPYVTKASVTDYNKGQNGYSSAQATSLFDNANRWNKADNYWGIPKTIKDGAQSKTAQSDIFNDSVQNYGINREMTQSMSASTAPVKKLYVEHIKRLTENSKGVNREIAQTNFLDHRGQNPVEKLVEQSSFKGLDSSPVVTKDNVYEQTPGKIQTQLNDTGKMVNSEISKLKRERENLLFDVQYGRIESDDEQLQKINYDIKYLQHIQKKIELGLKYQYHFATDELNSLSQADIDDIMNSKEEYSQNLPIYGQYGNLLRSTNKGYSSYQNSVGVVENIGVKYDLKEELFTIFDKNNPQNNFKFEIESEFSPKGYYESKIVVKDSDTIPDEKVYYDLAESLDGMVVPDKAKQQLEYFAEATKKPKLEYDGFGVADAVSYGLDFIDLMIIIGSDYQEDKELGVDSARETFGTIGSWLGNIAGTAAGVEMGAALGLTLGTPGMVVGSVLGVAFGAYLLSSALEDLGRYLGENINESEYPIERYYERGK